MGEVVVPPNCAVQEVCEAVACPFWTPVYTKPSVVMVDELLAYWLEVGGWHLTEDLGRVMSLNSINHVTKVFLLLTSISL